MSFFRSLFKGSPPPEGPGAKDARTSRELETTQPGVALDHETTVRLAKALVVLGVEVWRARGRLAKAAEASAKLAAVGGGEGGDARVLRHLESSIEKMNEALHSLGLRADDPTGRSWDERDAVKVLVFEATPGLTRARVLEVVKPTLYLGDSLLAAGEVVVGVPPSDDANANTDEARG